MIPRQRQWAQSKFAGVGVARAALRKPPRRGYHRAVIEPRVRGAAYRSAVDYVVEHYGFDALERVLAELCPNDRDAIERPIERDGWGPFSSWVAFVKQCDDTLGTGDLTLARASSAWAAKRDLPILFPDLSHSGTGADIVELSSQFWSSYYDAGRTEAVATAEADAVLFEVIDFPTPHTAHCNRIVGWLLGAFAVIGADVELTIPACRALGDDRCLFLARGEAMRDALSRV